MPDPLARHRGAIQQLRWRAEQLLEAHSHRPAAERSPLETLHREVLAGVGGALTSELFGRKRLGSSTGRAIAANAQFAQRQRERQAARTEARDVAQQARQLVSSTASVIGSRSAQSLSRLLAQADAAQRPETALRKVLEVAGRLEAWRLSAPTPIAGGPIIETLRNLERELRRCIESRLFRLSSNWWNERIPQDVRSRAERRKSLRERVWPWLDGGDHPLVEYLDFPDYSKIILDPQNWAQTFSSIFMDSDAIRVKLRELEPIRNDLAHSRSLTSANSERLRLYARELIQQMTS